MKKRFSIFLILFIFLNIAYSIPVYALGPSSNVIYQGIDVSVWQGNINFSQVRADGIEVVYIRSSQGFSYKDSKFEQNYRNAKANGLKVGFYHYVTARSVEEAQEQARFFASVISGKNPDCRLAVDFESFGNLSIEEINQITLAFAQETQRLTGKEMVIYSDAYNARSTFNQEIADNYPLWVAEYGVQEPESNGKWDYWVGFQYTSTGRVSGISGNVDRDYFTDGILLEGAEPIPEPENPISPNEISYTVQYGDTLAQIALNNNTSVNELVALNNISNPNLIYAGQQLIIHTREEGEEQGDTNHTLYVIKNGDTLTGIANRFQVTIQTLVEKNDIQNPNLIYAGYLIRI